MNFRVNLAVALAAAFGFACADKPANLPELEAAMEAAPGTQVLGLYAMTVTPVEGSDGKLFATAVIPVGQDGNPNTNPVGTIQVGGTFSAVTTAGPGGCAGLQALTAPVRITNFSVDPLSNVWVDILTTMGTTGTTACNSDSYLANGVGLTVADFTDGIWKYGNLAGSTAADGSLAGGTALPTTSGVWGFRFNNATPFRFFFRVVANNNAPNMGGEPVAGPNLAFTWTSPVVNTTRLQMCATNPGGQAACGAPLVNQDVTGTANAFSFNPTGLTQGATYYVRAANVFPAGTSLWFSAWIPFTYDAGLPVVAPTTLAANGAVDPLYSAMASWTTVDNGAAVQDSYAVLCLGTCPATRPVAADPNVLFDGPVQSTIASGGLSMFYLDLIVDLLPNALAVDATTLAYWDPAATYDFRVYPYDGISAAPAFAAAHGSGAITVTPVLIAPTTTPAAPATFSKAAANWNVAITADPGFATTLIDVCVPNCTIDPPGNLNQWTPTGGFVVPMTAGAGTFNYKGVTALNALAAGAVFEAIVYNPDLYQVYPVVPVTPVLYTIAP